MFFPNNPENRPQIISQDEEQSSSLECSLLLKINGRIASKLWQFVIKFHT
jgi:hypothetical protein